MTNCTQKKTFSFMGGIHIFINLEMNRLDSFFFFKSCFLEQIMLIIPIFNNNDCRFVVTHEIELGAITHRVDCFMGLLITLYNQTKVNTAQSELPDLCGDLIPRCYRKIEKE